MNRLRFRSGQTQLVKLPIDTRVRYWAGDLVCLVDGLAVPVTDFPSHYQGHNAMHAMPAFFLGVCHQEYNPNGSEKSLELSIDISPMSIYEFDVPPGDINFGDLLTSSFLHNQQLVTSTEDREIAIAMESRRPEQSTLRVSFCSAFHPASAGYLRRLKSLRSL